jgi:hypothetical protein
MSETKSITRHQPETRTGRGDPDKVAHIVMRDDQMRGYAAGDQIEALCGKVWVPSRDYQGLPICERCTAERDRIVSGMKRLN